VPENQSNTLRWTIMPRILPFRPQSINVAMMKKEHGVDSRTGNIRHRRCTDYLIVLQDSGVHSKPVVRLFSNKCQAMFPVTRVAYDCAYAGLPQVTIENRATALLDNTRNKFESKPESWIYSYLRTTRGVLCDDSRDSSQES